MHRAALIWAALCLPAAAGDLLFPVDCTLGQDCFVQQYVDRDPGPGVADYTCGPLSYDGHRGTDIRLVDEAAMDQGVDVVSASDGVVLGIRDGLSDIAQGAPGAPNVKGQECGNGVLVQRADGWRFQYCHLRKGTVAVRKGQPVTVGTRLGQVGQSGQAQFPHLHLTIRDQARRVIDPFDRRQQDESCTLADRSSLWRDLGGHSYQPGGLLSTGFADAIPEYSAIKSGAARHTAPGADAPALVFWAYLFGLRADDQIILTLAGPGGAVMAQSTHIMTRNRAVEFRAVGLKANGVWGSGRYQGHVTLRRRNRDIESTQRALILP